MNQIKRPSPLVGPLRTKINKLCHAQGKRHEDSLRVSMLAQIEHARDHGASFEQLMAMVNRLEVTQKRLAQECDK